MKHLYAIKLLSLASGELHPLSNTYVKRYNPSPHNLELGECVLEVTHNIQDAKMYSTVALALTDYKAVDERNPRRLDGRPNCPMTAFSITVVTVEVPTTNDLL